MREGLEVRGYSLRVIGGRTSNIEHPKSNIEVEEEEIYRKAAKPQRSPRNAEEEEMGDEIFNFRF